MASWTNINNKLHIFLIHGTWAGSGRWTHHDSIFRQKLVSQLQGNQPDVQGQEATLTYQRIDFTPIPWNGRNRSRVRDKVVKAVREEITNTISRQGFDWDYLIVAHSHGGNIATDALRGLLADDSAVAVRGVVCLNTPFFIHEVRGSAAYLVVWFLIALGLWFLHWRLDSGEPASGFFELPHNIISWALAILAALLFLLFIVSIVVRKSQRDREDNTRWGPRPNVLCLSCPDDEAITFLGLGEGVSNLPQLLLHPLGLIFLALGAGILLYAKRYLVWCYDPDCWHWQIDTIIQLFAIWVTTALVGGILGASAVTIMFGLPKRHVLKTLVSRVLVSYVPLLPAQTFFRCINYIRIRKPVQLFHSAIYRSPQTFSAIRDWLRRHDYRVQS